jgi:hypothetical protein
MKRRPYRKLPGWVRQTSHPVIVRTRYSTSGSLDFEGASPHLIGDDRELFLRAVRCDVSLCALEKAHRVFRQVPPQASLAPETCTPYVDANSFGYYVKNEMPLVFVHSRKGELLPDARVAVKYMRENAERFKGTLAVLERHAPRVFRPETYFALKARAPVLFSDVAQPYACFSDSFIALRIGCYAMTPPGVALIVGPPINQPAPLSVKTGLMESEWHHSELFLVFDCPTFEEEVLVIEPGTTLAQLYFAAAAANDETQVLFSPDDPGADPAYHARSIKVGVQMLENNKDFIKSKLRGVKSLSVSCPHCWVSITAAAEGNIPEDHVQVQDFYPGYKTLRAEYRAAIRGSRRRGNLTE